VAVNLGHLPGIETARLEQNAVVDGDLADVVQVAGDPQRADLLLREAEGAGDRDRDPRDPLRVAAGVRVLGVDRRPERADGVGVDRLEVAVETPVLVTGAAGGVRALAGGAAAPGCDADAI
jgi:hypothetical protein